MIQGANFANSTDCRRSPRNQAGTTSTDGRVEDPIGISEEMLAWRTDPLPRGVGSSCRSFCEFPMSAIDQEKVDLSPHSPQPNGLASGATQISPSIKYKPRTRFSKFFHKNRPGVEGQNGGSKC